MTDDGTRSGTTAFGDWSGFATADNVDDRLMQGFIGVDADRWQVVVVDLIIKAGLEEIVAYAVPNKGERTPDEMARMIGETGYLGVTRVVHTREAPPEHTGANPPEPVVMPITWVSEAIRSAFKNLRVQLVHRTVPTDCQILEVGSIV